MANMYYRYDITRDYYDCETCLWNGVCDQVTIELPAAAYFPSESGVRRSRVHITLDGCRYYTPMEGRERLSSVEHYRRDLDERAGDYRRLIDEFQ